MATAFVLINTEIGSEKEVLDEIRKIDAVKESYITYGVYDIVAKVSADTMYNLKEIIAWKVRLIDKLRSTITMILIDGEK